MEIEQNRLIVVDVDGVLVLDDGGVYEEREPNHDVLEKMREYSERGYYIILYTARNMRTFEGRLGMVNAETAPILLDWLEQHDVPYDEIYFGKPWCGHQGWYVDDKAIRPSEFVECNEEEILEIIDNS